MSHPDDSDQPTAEERTLSVATDRKVESFDEIAIDNSTGENLSVLCCSSDTNNTLYLHIVPEGVDEIHGSLTVNARTEVDQVIPMSEITVNRA